MSKTGRLQTGDFAIQNIPVRTEEARKIADAFRHTEPLDLDFTELEWLVWDMIPEVDNKGGVK